MTIGSNERDTSRNPGVVVEIANPSKSAAFIEAEMKLQHKS